MEYKDLLDSNERYGMTNEDIIKREGLENILENVIITPWWGHEIFEKFADKIVKCTDRIYNVYKNDISFSFVELKNIGAPRILDYVLSLGATKCKNLIFIGSVGAIDGNIDIGDIVIPEFSFCGVGTERYLNTNLEDNFETKNYPNNELTQRILTCAKQYSNETQIHFLPNYSIDTILAQFPHINHIISLGAKTIEMETSTVFKCAEITNIKATALLCVSDNTICKKSLYNGRTLHEKEKKDITKNRIIPQIIIDLFCL